LPLFLLTQKAQKPRSIKSLLIRAFLGTLSRIASQPRKVTRQIKVLSKKKMPEREFRLCGGDQGSAFGNRKLLKKFDQNFPVITPLN
jgi:hypothetical protein